MSSRYLEGVVAGFNLSNALWQAALFSGPSLRKSQRASINALSFMVKERVHHLGDSSGKLRFLKPPEHRLWGEYDFLGACKNVNFVRPHFDICSLVMMRCLWMSSKSVGTGSQSSHIPFHALSHILPISYPYSKSISQCSLDPTCRTILYVQHKGKGLILSLLFWRKQGQDRYSSIPINFTCQKLDKDDASFCNLYVLLIRRQKAQWHKFRRKSEISWRSAWFGKQREPRVSIHSSTDAV